MRKQLALLLTLIFLLNLVVVDNQYAELQNSQSSSNTIGSYSNYTMDIRTDLLDYNRAKYLTYLKTDYGIKTLNYDDYENAWYYREINNGTWYEQPIYYQADDYQETESIKFVLTDFGIFMITIQTWGNCAGTDSRNYRLQVLNYSNSSSHMNDMYFCSKTGTGFSSLNAASFDYGFSFGFSSWVWNTNANQDLYQENLITIYQNGTYENRQNTQRNGAPDFNLISNRIRVISTNDVSCFELKDFGSPGGPTILLKCFDHSSGQDFQHKLCNTPSYCWAALEPIYVRNNDEIIILDSGSVNSASGGVTTSITTNDYYSLNKSGIQSLNLNWQPQSCGDYKGSPSGYNVNLEIFSIDDYFYCSPGQGESFFWHPTNNQSISIPSELRNANYYPQSAVPFYSGITATPPNWLLTNSRGNFPSGASFNYGVLWSDYDSDSVRDSIDSFPYDNSQSIDSDGDGFGDSPTGNFSDACPSEYGNSTNDRFGCSDFDSDGWSDTRDFFPNDDSQWNDTDLDNYGDNPLGNFPDSCPQHYGTSSRNNTFGCEDLDFDGWADFQDFLPNDSSQWSDSDMDGYGDELNGYQGDSCPSIYGNSSNDRFGCLDSDGDGWSDDGDALPNNPTQWIDRDGDGFGDNQSGTEPDVFPTDGTQWIDLDGDGYGDNILGNQGDAFPDDPLEWKDSDGDGLGDNADMFPFDPTQTEDRDGDGMGDNPMGIGADKFPDDPTQWGDIDGDGYGDNPLGNNPDVFITDATQWFDEDGDGYGDNPTGRLYDQFPQNPTQWEDADEDGLGDNQSGTDADPFLNDFDNDGYNDSIDILPKLSSPGDLDADGCLDEFDAFPSDSQECIDTDGDGVGNNADSDDDGDGWTDADEERVGTDSLSASDTPVDSFEIVIPGTAVGLGAWDLIGIFGGIPLFAWIGFGFVTRNGRCARYEELLKEATSRDELEQVALRWEYSLMLRMLGPHQGIRLERLRAELDDKFENATYDETDIGFDQTSIVENEGKDIPPINESFTGPTKETAATSTDESGYEWFKQGEENWYRPVGSEDEWLRVEG